MLTKPTSRFRELLSNGGIIPAPGAYDCLSAAIIEKAGFPAVYMTGAGTSLSKVGYPDLGLATMNDMVSNAAAIAASINVPLIADADTGYGDVLQVRRTIREFERAGVSAIHIEDQQSPKRCGHLEDKSVISIPEMVRKLHAALDARSDDSFTIIARCDAIAVTGWDDALKRCEAYVEAGADVLFLEAIRDETQARFVTSHFDIPVLYNFVETGKSPLIPLSKLEQLGVRIAIFPVSALLAVTKTITRVMEELREFGTTQAIVDNEMANIHECFDILGMNDLLSLDATYAAR